MNVRDIVQNIDNAIQKLSQDFHNWSSNIQNGCEKFPIIVMGVGVKVEEFKGKKYLVFVLRDKRVKFEKKRETLEVQGVNVNGKLTLKEKTPTENPFDVKSGSSSDDVSAIGSFTTFTVNSDGSITVTTTGDTNYTTTIE